VKRFYPTYFNNIYTNFIKSQIDNYLKSNYKYYFLRKWALRKKIVSYEITHTVSHHTVYKHAAVLILTVTQIPFGYEVLSHLTNDTLIVRWRDEGEFTLGE